MHQHHLNLDLTDEYKSLMDAMLDQENSGKAEYVSFKKIKDRFLPK